MGERITLRRCEHSRHSRFIGCPRCFTGPVRVGARPALFGDSAFSRLSRSISADFSVVVPGASGIDVPCRTTCCSESR
jgi:hypothetical protein